MNSLTEYPLSRIQRDFCFIEKYFSDSPDVRQMFAVGTGLYDSECFNADALEQAYFEVLRRNDIFRMKVLKKPFFRAAMVIQDVSSFPRPERETITGREAFEKMCREPEYPEIRADSDFLTKAKIYQAQDGTGGMIIWQHHVCTDGYSAYDIAYEQINSFYLDYKEKRTPKPAKREFSFIPTVQKEQEHKGKKWKSDFMWCAKEFNRHLFRFSVPFDVTGDAVSPQFVSLNIRGDLMDGYKKVRSELSFSDTSFFMSMIAILINSLTGAKRFAIYTESHGRTNYPEKNTCGPLIKEIPLFYEPLPEMKVKELFDYSFVKFMEAFNHYQFSGIVSEIFLAFFQRLLRIGWRKDVNWITFNNLSSYQSIPSGGLELVQIESASWGKEFAVELYGLKEEEGFQVSFYFDESLLSTDRARAIVGCFDSLIEAFLKNPDMMISDSMELINNRIGKN